MFHRSPPRPLRPTVGIYAKVEQKLLAGRVTVSEEGFTQTLTRTAVIMVVS